MKAQWLAMVMVFSVGVPAVAQAAPQGIQPKILGYLVDRVRNCAILPYTLNERGQKVYHAIQSHCPEVKVIGPGTARARVAGHAFEVRIAESSYSDGDFFDVEFFDLMAVDRERFEGVLAFGDVLWAVLGGKTEGLYERHVQNGPWIQEANRNLLKPSF